jgi:ion channel-forming bestrophin family protein
MIEYSKHDWTGHLFEVQGTMVREIVGRVSACVAWAVLVVAFHRYARLVHIAPTAHTLVGVALGLLLVFRTNASYDRFWEGRRQWGSIINECRNLARASRAFLGRERELFEGIVRWTIALPYAIMNSLRGTSGIGPIADELPADEAAAVRAANHPPLAISARISERIAEAASRGAISDYVAMTLDQNVQQLVDYLGACERIYKTPLPFVYVVHLRRALIVYCFTLPFALVDAYGWWTIPATLLVAYLFFGIEEIGVEIENPFGHDDNDLPLETFCETIERNLREILDGAGEERAADRESVPGVSA